jgi:hypothetical protein
MRPGEPAPIASKARRWVNHGRLGPVTPGAVAGRGQSTGPTDVPSVLRRLPSARTRCHFRFPAACAAPQVRAQVLALAAARCRQGQVLLRPPAAASTFWVPRGQVRASRHPGELTRASASLGALGPTLRADPGGHAQRLRGASTATMAARGSARHPGYGPLGGGRTRSFRSERGRFAMGWPALLWAGRLPYGLPHLADQDRPEEAIALAVDCAPPVALTGAGDDAVDLTVEMPARSAGG